MRRFVAATLLAAACHDPVDDDPVQPQDPPLCASLEVEAPLAAVGYHGADRLGWNDAETSLNPASVVSGDLGVAWVSEQFADETIDGQLYPPTVYGPPLYADHVEIRIDEHHRVQTSVAIAATTNGWIYAVNAAPVHGHCNLRAGSTLWRTKLAHPMLAERLDGGMPIGVLSTPRLDLMADPPRIYVVALDDEIGWAAFGVGLADGEILEGWPIAIDDASLGVVNTNGPARFWQPELMSQRGALQISPDGDRLYVPFGTFWGDGAGWLVAIDTHAPRITAAFSSAPHLERSSSGGIWGSAGPAVAADGRIYATTGNSPPGTGPAAGVWGNSLLELSADLQLQRAYSPFNYCVLDDANMDLGASQPLLVPSLPDTTTPNTIAFGGKQGNVYLLDRDALADAGQRRHECSDDASTDASLLPPQAQPQFGTRGPLNVFGPYSDEFGEIDHAKMRTKLASFRDGDGQTWLFAAGSTKESEDSTLNVAPSIAKLRVVARDGEAAYLEVDRYNPDVVFANPGSPVVTSHEGQDPLVWVLDRNAPRTAALLDRQTPGPVLYAFDAETMALLWRSAEGEIGPTGKYGTPTIVHGQIFLATDRLVAMDVGPLASPTPTAPPQLGRLGRFGRL